MKLLLDSGVLLQVLHPRPDKHRDYREAKEWFHRLIDEAEPRHEVLISVLVDFELEKYLAQLNAVESEKKLSTLTDNLRTLSITLSTVRKARALLHQAQGSRLSDTDVLLLAQAELEGAVIVSEDSALRAAGEKMGIPVQSWRMIPV